MNLTPLKKNVVIEPTAPPKFTQAGIHLPEVDSVKNTTQGRVIALGSLCDEPELKVGSHVIFDEIDATPVKVDYWKTYLIVKQANVLAAL